MSSSNLERADRVDVFAHGQVVTAARFSKRVKVGQTAGPSVHHLSGVAGCGAVWLSVELLKAGHSAVVLVCADPERAHRALADARFLIERESHNSGHNFGEAVAVLAEESDPYAPAQPDRRGMLGRIAALTRLAQGATRLTITSAHTLVRKLPPAQVLLEASARLLVNSDVDLAALRVTLSAGGYTQVPVVEDPGSFAIRGGIVDVWGSDAKAPVRAELFGDAVLSLKEFDPDSQRTRREVQEVFLPPAREAIASLELQRRAQARLRELCDEQDYPSLKARTLIDDVTLGRHAFGSAGYLPAFYELASLWDYFAGQEVFVFEQPTECKIRIEAEFLRSQNFDNSAQERPQFPPTALYLDEREFEGFARRHTIVSASSSAVLGGARESVLDQLDAPPAEPESLAQEDQTELERAIKQARATTGKGAALDPLIQCLNTWHEEGLHVECVVRSNTQAQRLVTLLAHRDVRFVLALHGSAYDSADDEASLEADHSAPASAASDAQVVVSTGTLERGLISRGDRLVLLTEEEIFGHKAHTRPKRSKRSRAPLEDLRALKPGDFVIHSEHGVGKYLGLENRALASGTHVELLVVEYAGGKLFLPVYRLNQIEKYAGGEAPKLDRLGGTSFAKTKAKARAKAREMADELLRLYAERSAVEKQPLAPTDDEYAAFEAAFPYEETSDQAAAILDVQSDLSQPKVMDRLVCGDVGFGKTEVALRAAFRAAANGRQVAVLCPTTVLAQQHYLTFKKRLQDYPIEVRALSRFETKSAITDTLKRLKEGSVDIVVGTHRLLSKDVQFKELGLLVIDEEQRFGVVHKERLKRMRTQVDVLTLTATPIPRTLQLALGGLREVSYISTPPADRRSIRTIVSRFDEGIVKEAVERELNRGGQVYYVYNRVEGLYERAQRLQTLVPSARIGVGHGQMREGALEQVMLDFIEGNTDVLVATAIVESGLDIPRANTMIIDRADLFGLAQLYQLRGRVGRSELRAYCYLLVPAPADMNEDARNRIEALERYTELGSGFQIATLDMELRGTGDLLGADQSGTVATVGLELFCRMLEEATAELRGEEVVHDIDPELNFDIEALLPENYIEEVGVRLSFYKRLASASDENDVLHLAQEMEDRFGGAPPEALRFIELMRLKTELRRLKVLVCEATAGSVSVRFRDDTPVDAVRLANLVATQKAKYRLSPDGRLTRKPKETETHLGSLGLTEKMLEELASATAE